MGLQPGQLELDPAEKTLTGNGWVLDRLLSSRKDFISRQGEVGARNCLDQI